MSTENMERCPFCKEQELQKKITALADENTRLKTALEQYAYGFHLDRLDRWPDFDYEWRFVKSDRYKGGPVMACQALGVNVPGEAT